MTGETPWPFFVSFIRWPFNQTTSFYQTQWRRQTHLKAHQATSLRVVLVSFNSSVQLWLLHLIERVIMGSIQCPEQSAVSQRSEDSSTRSQPCKLDRLAPILRIRSSHLLHPHPPPRPKCDLPFFSLMLFYV